MGHFGILNTILNMSLHLFKERTRRKRLLHTIQHNQLFHWSNSVNSSCGYASVLYERIIQLWLGHTNANRTNNSWARCWCDPHFQRRTQRWQHNARHRLGQKCAWDSIKWSSASSRTDQVEPEPMCTNLDPRWWPTSDGFDVLRWQCETKQLQGDQNWAFSI